MMNLAILLGVGSYESLDDLPAVCKDINVIDTVLRTGGHFNQIHSLTSTDAATVKDALASLIERFQNDEIGDLLFYFTGHGEVVQGDYRYLLRDYDKDHVSKTSLSNSSLDEMLKSLNPILVTKIIDACYSGTAYIKSDSIVEDTFSKSKGNFSRCYFMFSSQNDQLSYADESISDFTLAFARSVLEPSPGAIRYSRIIESISDAFAGGGNQKPQFVSQANFTEVFGIFSAAGQNCIRALVSPPSDMATVSADVAVLYSIEGKPSLAVLAATAASEFGTSECARNTVAALKNAIEVKKLFGDLDDLYHLEPKFFDDYYEVPNVKSLGEWAAANNNKGYFIEPRYIEQKYEIPNPLLFRTVFDPETIMKKRFIIDGIETHVGDMSFIACAAILSPKYPSLDQYAGWISYILSKKVIEIFTTFVEYTEISWGTYKVVAPPRWVRNTISIADLNGAVEQVDAFFLSLEQAVLDRVKAQLLPKRPVSDSHRD